MPKFSELGWKIKKQYFKPYKNKHSSLTCCNVSLTLELVLLCSKTNLCVWFLSLENSSPEELSYGKENAVKTLQRKNKWRNKKLRCIYGLD